jgi:hypothetical protein
MPIDDFQSKMPPLSDTEAKRLIQGFSDTLGTWLDVWGEHNNVPKEKRFDAFMTVADLGYRIAKRDIETDRLERLIS